MTDTPMQGREPAAAPSKPLDASPPYGFPDAPGVRQVSGADILGALGDGWRDFLRAPQYGLFFGGVFAAGGWLLLACLTVWDTVWGIVPLAVAFPLIGPFVAVGLYEVSRRLSSGEPLRWSAVLGVVLQQKDRQLAWMAFVTLFIFWIWAYQVRLLLALFLGFSAFSSFEGFLNAVLSTENGLTFLVVGTVIGAGLALILFSVTVISMPLLVARDYDVITAMVTSVTTVRRSPVPMVLWGAAVTILMLLALAPAFLGLLVILPVLGHATWRLYERAIVLPKG